MLSVMKVLGVGSNVRQRM